MPNTKSAIKAARQNLKRRITNLAVLKKVSQATKQVRKLTAGGQPDEAKKLLQTASAALDKAAKKHVIHKNKASRLKSRLAKLIVKISAKGGSASGGKAA